ncbi:nuclear pore complex protein Nup155-like isoform X2 [Babylonia areolata]|uniref:nuclear pore complex protein Nup155-like isoform X2 n=1 Tax=Babylonia areolata TaxID=304850 RepID=UPI003FD534E2
MASILGGGLPPLSVQDMLENSARLVDKFLQDDRSYLDLSEQLQIPSHSQPTVSGLHDFDYPSLLEAGVGLDALPELSSIKRLPLPPELTEQFDRMQCNCMMGLFPEIQRAFLTIDSDIFVWKYEDGSDLAYFDGLNEAILSVALVKPKPGIFQPHIQNLLCVATPVDIVLLGVSFSKLHDVACGEPGSGEMHLLPEPLYSIPTDNTFITSIVGTDNGRIFMAGKDGALYELIYQAEDGWFSRKCRKVCHSTSALSFLVPSFFNFTFSQDDPLVQISIDDSRHILYGRTQKGSIQVYDLGRDGKGMSRVASVSQQTILHSALATARTVEKSHFKSIVHVSAITASESANLHVVAITQSGVRLYFTTSMFNTQFTGPSMLTLVHVRLPPGFSAGSTQPPSKVHTAYHGSGTLLLMSSQNDDNDLLWAISSDSFPFQKQLMETQVKVPIDGRTWALGEIRPPESRIQAAPSDGQQPDPPVVVSQHMEPSRRFIVLSAQGCHILRKLRPVEQLHSLLIDCGGPDAEEVKAFFRLHRLDQACATCLVLASSRSPGDGQVSDWARMAFFMYGGEAQYNFGATASGMQPTTIGATPFTNTAGGGNMSNTILYSPGSSSAITAMTPMPGMVPAHTSTPMPFNTSLHQPTVGPVPGGLQDVLYSGKHNGIYIYLARILRPFWDRPVTAELQCQTQQGPKVYLTSNYSSAELSLTLEQVRDLSDFVDFNSKFDSGAPSDLMSPAHVPSRLRFGEGAMDEQTRKKLQSEAQRVEKISLQHVQELLHRVEEVLGLWRVLLDHQFHTLAHALSQDLQNQLRSLTFKTLVLTGKDVCMALITCLIGRYLDDNATVDAISGSLREVCPSLYSTDDATCSKADELLQKVRATQDPMERRRQLQEALRLLKSVTTPLKLGVVCHRLVTVNHFTGVLELCLAEARKYDPHDLAHHFYSQGEQPEDTQGMQAYISRMECYKCVTEILAYLWNAATAQPQSPSMPKSPGPPPPTHDPNRMAAEQAEQQREEVLQMAFKSNDVLFHSALYDWLFSTNRADILLEVGTPYLESYLQRRASQAEDKVKALDMLWKHYEKTNNFSASAHILSQLSQRHGTDLTLAQRIEYLSRAIMCAKSATSLGGKAASGEFLHELEEKMEVARLQLQVLNCLQRVGDTLSVGTQDMREAQQQLQAVLLDITTLYEEYADRFDLWECKLAIVYCAGLFDSALIENLWQNIINKELTFPAGVRARDQLAGISERLVGIMKSYVSAERYFPLAFIVRHLEQRSCELDLGQRWVFVALMEVGVPPAKLLELYDRLFKSRDPFWQTVRKPYHLLTVLHALLAHLADNPSLTPPQDRRRFGLVCTDAVSTYLIELQAMKPDPTITLLLSQFKGVRARLERF